MLLIIVGIVTFTICVIALPSNSLAQKETIDNVETENAATHYLKAFESLKYPESKRIDALMQSIIRNGWQKDDEILERILAKNELSFIEFEKALLIEKCDFTFGKKYKYLIDKEPIDLIKIKNLFNLLLLKGRSYENQEDLDNAIDTYLSTLILAEHVSQDDTLISKLIALNLEETTYVLLTDYFVVAEINIGGKEKISKFLELYKKVHFLGNELVESEKLFFISTMQMLVDNIQEQVTEKNIRNNKMKSPNAFKADFMNQVNALANEYYGNFAKAIETNQEEDWGFATAEFESFKKETNSTAEMVKDVGNMLFKSIINDTEGYNKVVTRRIVSTTLTVAMPDFRKVAQSYYSTLKKLKLLLD